MFIINGALAAFNGVLAAAGSWWCQCVCGGVCCGGECRTDEGVCCGNVWHPDADPNQPCAEGQVFVQWGTNNECCGCLSETVFDGRVQEMVNTVDVKDDLCCPLCTASTVFLPWNDVGDYIGCMGRCCVDGGCTNTLQAGCGGAWSLGCCETLGCEKACCEEDSTGVVACSVVSEFACPGTVDNQASCGDACKGACCLDCTELSEFSPMTQAACEAIGGFFMGVGSTSCLDDQPQCRPPFTPGCCEHVVSNAAALTFTGPRKRRCPETQACRTQATVTVKTNSPVYVHGSLFGKPYEACGEVATFVTCNDQFDVRPASCQGNLDNLDIEVCWEEGTGDELLEFRCCTGATYLLGNCDCGCATTLVYSGPGCTSSAPVVLNGNATIEANGSGPLVLTTAFLAQKSCARTLKLAGSSPHDNSVPAIPNPPSNSTSLAKTGPGRWVLSAASGYTGSTTVEQGELVLGVTTAGGGDGALGNNGADAPITLGSSAGPAALLLKAGKSFADRVVTIPAGTQAVALGGADSSGTATFSNTLDVSLGRDVTLLAATGGTARFNNAWFGTTGRNVTIGTSGNAGTVLFNGTVGKLTTTGTVYVNFGTLSAGSNGLPGPTAIVVASVMDVVNFKASAALTLTTTGRATISGTGLSIGDVTNNNATDADALDFTGTGGGNTVDSLSGNGNTTFRGSVTVKELNGGTIALSSGVAMTVEQGASSNVISGAGSLVKTTAGTVTLSAANTFSGGTTINGGAMTAGHADAFGTGAIVVNAGGTLNKNGFTLPNTITNNGGTVNS